MIVGIRGTINFSNSALLMVPVDINNSFAGL